MTVSVYLHDEIYNVLRCFGSLSDVANKILRESLNSGLLKNGVPYAPNREGAKRYNIDITDMYFIRAMTDPERAHKYNIRGILYAFVENEWYNIFGWAIETQFKGKRYDALRKAISNIQTNIEQAQRLCWNPETAKQLTHILEEVTNIDLS